MARIRTIKPEFFRHEELQDLETANSGKYVMLVFAGLWGHCDNKGRFEWRPRQLKLDILPFLSFDMAETLDVLNRAGLVSHYTANGKEYGEVPSFEKHQRLSGKEVTEGEKHPANNREATGKQQGSAGDEPESQEGKRKGREKEGERSLPPPASPAPTVPVPKPKKAESTPLQIACRETWDSYCQAYRSRYGTDPVGNRTVYSQVKGFVQRIGFDEAPQVASFYLTHNEAFYVKKAHSFGLALSDAEKLRTEWVTGRMTEQRAPPMTAAAASTLAAARTIFGTEIEGKQNGKSGNIIDITPAARAMGSEDFPRIAR